MSLCINPNCHNPNNDDNYLYCQACGSTLLLKGLYRVRQQIGKGGFGKTYSVDDSATAKVLKVLSLNNAIAERLFKQEANVLSTLNHHGIPKVASDGYFIIYPRGSQEPIHCLVMEKIEGEDLEKWLQNHGKPISQKLALIILLTVRYNCANASVECTVFPHKCNS